MDFLKDLVKTLGGKIVGSIVGGIVALAVVIAAVSWFTMSPAEKQQIVSGAGSVMKAIGLFLGWIALVGVLPWATFFVIAKIGQSQSNWPGVALVVGYTGMEAALLAWLYGWGVQGVAAWVFFLAAVLLAGVYNLLLCDWLAEKLA